MEPCDEAVLGSCSASFTEEQRNVSLCCGICDGEGLGMCVRRREKEVHVCDEMEEVHVCEEQGGDTYV